MSPKDYFYVRYLQWKMYFSKNAHIKALFYLENYLFENYNFNDEKVISNLKLKWIYDQISKCEFSNEITQNLIAFNNKDFLKKILNLIELYNDLIYIEDKIDFINNFKVFNNKFNDIILLSKAKGFKSSYLFQLIQFRYTNFLDINYDLIGNYLLKKKKDQLMFLN